MRTLFPGYYTPSQDELNKLWREATIVPDTNVLLNLYKYSNETAEKFIDILRELSERIWIPHQVALEYQEGRLSVIRSQRDIYDKAKDAIEKTSPLQQLKNLFTGRRQEELSEIVSVYEKAVRKMIRELDKLSDNHPDLVSSDTIRQAIEDIIDNRIGPAYDQQRLLDIRKQWQNRKDEKVPPGFRDYQEGDLIIWFQILDYVAETQNSILFITDDSKDDWWWKDGDLLLGGPHPQLVHELKTRADVGFYAYPSGRFFKLAQEYLNQIPDKDAIDEVQELSELEEKSTAVQFPAVAAVADAYNRILRDYLATRETLNQFAYSREEILKEYESIQRLIPSISQDALEARKRIQELLPSITLNTLAAEAIRSRHLIDALLGKRSSGKEESATEEKELKKPDAPKDEASG